MSDDDGEVTEADLREARERWADPAHEPAAKELFARAVTGSGVRGDVRIGADEEPPESSEKPGS